MSGVLQHRKDSKTSSHTKKNSEPYWNYRSLRRILGDRDTDWFSGVCVWSLWAAEPRRFQ